MSLLIWNKTNHIFSLSLYYMRETVKYKWGKKPSEVCVPDRGGQGSVVFANKSAPNSF